MNNSIEIQYESRYTIHIYNNNNNNNKYNNDNNNDNNNNDPLSNTLIIPPVYIKSIIFSLVNRHNIL